MKKTLFVALMMAGFAQAGEFTVKGIKFGMSNAEIVEIVGSTESDYSKGIDRTTYSCASSLCTFNGFSIGGITGWTSPNSTLPLEKMYTFPKSEKIEDALSVFTEAYGKPKTFSRYQSKTKGGLTLDDFTAVWFVKDAVITMNKHIDRDTGYISIQSLENYDAERAKFNTDKEKAKKDF